MLVFFKAITQIFLFSVSWTTTTPLKQDSTLYSLSQSVFFFVYPYLLLSYSSRFLWVIRDRIIYRQQRMNMVLFLQKGILHYSGFNSFLTIFLIYFSVAGATMIPISWDLMQCPKTKMTEHRKVAKV